MNIIRLGLILFFITVSMTILQSQSEELDSSYMDEKARLLEFTFNINNPLGTLSNNIGQALYGASGTLLMQRDSERYSYYGIDFSYAHLGSLTNTITSNGFPEEDRTSTNYISAQFVYRYYTTFHTTRIEPFIDVKLGPHLMYTATSITFLDGSGGTDFLFEETDFGLAYAVEAGANFNLGNSFFGTLKFGYTGGTATSYSVPADAILLEFPIDNFTKFTSAISFLTTKIGVAFSF